MFLKNGLFFILALCGVYLTKLGVNFFFNPKPLLNSEFILLAVLLSPLFEEALRFLIIMPFMKLGVPNYSLLTFGAVWGFAESYLKNSNKIERYFEIAKNDVSILVNIFVLPILATVLLHILLSSVYCWKKYNPFLLLFVVIFLHVMNNALGIASISFWKSQLVYYNWIRLIVILALIYFTYFGATRLDGHNEKIV